MRRVVVLGSTGSIGRAALEVIEKLPDHLRAIGLATRNNVELLAEQARRVRPLAVAVAERGREGTLRQLLHGLDVEVYAGEEGLLTLAGLDEADIVVVATVGISGLRPTLEALRKGKDVALANKETLVAAGHLVMAEARRRGCRILPVDSEHSAIFQCLVGEDPGMVKRLILTASGGPFLRTPLEDLARVTPEEALLHPTWNMGRKVTVDSATLMNKGLEVIEAHWLFGIEAERIQVVIHPQSLVHSMVEFLDGSIKAQIAASDMRIPIQYALTFPKRMATGIKELDWRKVTLTFEEPDPARFPCLSYAYEALEAGGTMPTVLNASNEVAVELFLAGRIGFLDIPRCIRYAMDRHVPVADPDLEMVMAVDRWAREQVLSLASLSPTERG
ncbi:MAG: 1-deoxy-D-xylulose-5-phosphate reductoisomerase [Armatimonadota bacterium]|nr:1-deoxy-D-xylulose-5-phosphate reductoisomerase [Armatimonadota bacterium]